MTHSPSARLGRYGDPLDPDGDLATMAAIGLYPIVTLEKQLPNMIGNLV